jgi:hypothetical protein
MQRGCYCGRIPGSRLFGRGQGRKMYIYKNQLYVLHKDLCIFCELLWFDGGHEKLYNVCSDLFLLMWIVKWHLVDASGAKPKQEDTL